MPEIGNLSERLRELQHEAEAVLTTFDKTSGEIGDALRTRMASHPYAVLAAAAGVGYVLGGGLPSVLTRLIVVAGGRVGFELLSRELGSRFLENVSGGGPAGNGGEPQRDNEAKGNES